MTVLAEAEPNFERRKVIVEPRSKAPAYEVGHTAPGFCCRCSRQVLCRFSDAGGNDLTIRSGGRRPKSARHEIAAAGGAASSSDVVLLRRRISGVRILHLALTHWPRKDRAPPGRFFAPSPLRFIGARPACDGVGQANGKSLLLFPGPTIETEGLFLDVFHQDRAGAWRELRGPQHAFNDRC